VLIIVSPFRFVKPQKASKWWSSNEVFTLEALADIVPEGRYFVSKKFDGYRAQLHKKGKNIKLYTSTGRDVTKRFPSLVNDATKLIVTSVILDGELVTYKNEKPLRRTAVADLVMGKDEPDDSGIIFHVFDTIYFDGKDVHKLPLSERISLLHKLNQTKHIRKLSFSSDVSKNAEEYLVSTTNDLLKAVKKVSRLVGSEGAMVKSADGIYELDGETRTWYKFKKTLQVDALVIDKKLISGAKETYQYSCAVGPITKELANKIGETAVVYKGKFYMKIGKTFNTNVKANVGDIITVDVLEIRKWDDATYTWMIPRVIDVRFDKKKPDPLSVLDRVAEVTPRELSKEFVFDFLQEVKISRFLQSNYSIKTLKLDIFKPPKKKKARYVMQYHDRGKSRHTDLRLEWDGFLVGLTLFDPGRIGKPPKLSNKPGMDGKKIQCIFKPNQPKTWLDFEGYVPPGQVGATERLPATFKIIDKGTFLMGTQKSDFLEFFLFGKRFNGRFVARKTDLPPRGEPGERIEERPVWLFWKPKDQRPYVGVDNPTEEQYVKRAKEIGLPNDYIKKYILQRLNKEYSMSDIYEHPVVQELLTQLSNVETSGNTLQKTMKNHCGKTFVTLSLPITKYEELDKSDFPLVVEGIAIREGKMNGVYYDANELEKGYDSLKGRLIKIDHSDSVRDHIGRVLDVSWNDKLKQIEFTGGICDPDIINKIKHKLVEGVSVGVFIDEESTDRGPSAKNLEFVEVSLVEDPACPGCMIKLSAVPGDTNEKILLSSKYNNSKEVNSSMAKEKKIAEEEAVKEETPTSEEIVKEPSTEEEVKTTEDVTEAEAPAEGQKYPAPYPHTHPELEEAIKKLTARVDALEKKISEMSASENEESNVELEKTDEIEEIKNELKQLKEEISKPVVKAIKSEEDGLEDKDFARLARDYLKRRQ